MNPAAKLAGGLVAVVVAASWLPDGRSTEPQRVDVRPVQATDAAAPHDPPAAAATSSRAEPTSPPPAPPAAASAPLLTAASGGDGDSWRDTAGREYRLGMVNAPEVG